MKFARELAQCEKTASQNFPVASSCFQSSPQFFLEEKDVVGALGNNMLNLVLRTSSVFFAAFTSEAFHWSWKSLDNIGSFLWQSQAA